MTKGAACLSESFSLAQERCVQTKAPLNRDNLQQFLSGLMNRSYDLNQASGEIKSYLGAFFDGERKISFRLINLLYVIVSSDLPVLPSRKGLRDLHQGWMKYWEKYDLDAADIFEEFLGTFEYFSEKNSFWDLLFRLFKEESPVKFKKAFHNIAAISKPEYAYVLDYVFDDYTDFLEFALTDKKNLIQYCNTLNQCSGLSDEDRLILVNSRFGNHVWQSTLEPYEAEGIRRLSEIKHKSRTRIIEEFLLLSPKYTTHQRKIFIDHLSFWILNYKLKERKESSLIFIKQILFGNDNRKSMDLLLNLLEDDRKELEKLLDHILFISEFYPSIAKMKVADLYRNLVFYLKNREHAVRPFDTIDQLIDLSNYSFSHFAYEILGHLFFRYEVPWLLIKRLKEIPNGYELLEWLIRYNKLKDFKDLPVNITRKEAHVFFTMYSKNSFYMLNGESRNILHAGLILAKLKNIYNDRSFFHCLDSYFLNDVLLFEPEFWEDLARFFRRYREHIATNDIRNLLDYIVAKKQEQPDYTLKGRTYSSVNRSLHQWHQQLGEMRFFREYDINLNARWAGLSIPNDRIERKGVEYHFYQIRNQRELNEEGTKMQHCAASYGRRCFEENVSIWSLRIYNQKGIQRLLTIEIRKNEIVQAKGEGNRMPSSKEKEILRIWAEKHGFIFRSC